MKKFFSHLRFFRATERGVALLMVLASLTLLSGIVLEMSHSSLVTYNVAFNQKERYQAYYLAHSGLTFSKLLIHFDKEIQKMAKEATKDKKVSITVPRLYEMVPVDSSMLRTLSQLQGGLSAEEGSEKEEEGEEGQASIVEKQKQLGGFDLKSLQEFLGFEGNFAGEIEEENVKLNINAFYSLSPKNKEYDRLKSALYYILIRDEFKDLFEDRYRDAKALAQNIVDYIDKDHVHNEPEGGERGREAGGLTSTDKMKNGKLLTIEELVMIPGVTEELYQKLKPYVTVYGRDQKVNVCRAEEPVVRALVLAYTENNPKMEPLKPENEDLLEKATGAVLGSCPETKNMTKELDKVLGVKEEKETNDQKQKQKQKQQKKKTVKKSPKKSADVFENFVSKDSTIFSITGIGTVGETEVRLKTVVDATGADPSSWRQLYWRVE